MNAIQLGLRYLLHKPLNTLLSTVLFALGIFITIVLLQVGKQMETNLSNNSKGIDLVVGAKGSPMQIVLSSVFHIDYPTGNIPLLEAEKLTKNRYVKEVIPMALGDAYAGFRIVGTTIKYTEHYHAELATGQLWADHMEVVLGHNVAKRLGLSVGEEFMGQHGLIPDGGYDHEGHGYKVVGVLAAANAVIDNLILTSVQSVWEVHGDDEHEAHPADSIVMSKVVPGVNLYSEDSTQDVTSLLVKYRSPMAAMQLPRYVNKNTSMQAASPAFELARLLTIVGVGVEMVQGFAYLIVVIAMLSIFIALYNAMKERKYDLAIMRAMGATKRKLFFGLLTEGLMVTLVGAIIGMAAAHGTLGLISRLYDQSGNMAMSGTIFYQEELIVLLLSVGIGMVSSVIPAIGVYKVDISKVLSDE